MADNRRLSQHNSSRPLTNEDGSPSAQLNTWLRVVTSQSMIIGSGSPEGVVEAIQTSSYMDEDAALGFVLYVKQKADDGLGDTTKGWALIG